MVIFLFIKSFSRPPMVRLNLVRQSDCLFKKMKALLQLTAQNQRFVFFQTWITVISGSKALQREFQFQLYAQASLSKFVTPTSPGCGLLIVSKSSACIPTSFSVTARGVHRTCTAHLLLPAVRDSTDKYLVHIYVHILLSAFRDNRGST
jgi:hypothetical protein